MVDLLVEVHAEEGVRFDLAVGPPDVPVAGPLIFLYDPSKLLCNFLDDGVLCV